MVGNVKMSRTLPNREYLVSCFQHFVQTRLRRASQTSKTLYEIIPPLTNEIYLLLSLIEIMKQSKLVKSTKKILDKRNEICRPILNKKTFEVRYYG